MKFDRSRPAIIFCFSTILEHVSYPLTMLPIDPRYIRTSSRWWVHLCCPRIHHRWCPTSHWHTLPLPLFSQSCFPQV